MSEAPEGTTAGGVASTPIQAAEVQEQNSWMEPSVWTERMRTALEKGVKGGKWFSLIDKVWKKENLSRSYERVARNKGCAGVDHVSTEGYGRNLERETERLHRALQEGRYRPQALRRKEIPKSGGKGKRPLSIPTVRDRVLHTAVRHVIEPIFERTFAGCSYGFRPGRGCKDALREVVNLLEAGHLHVVDADLSRCFDTIPHGPLLKRVDEQVADGRLLELLGTFLKQGVMANGVIREADEGTPQGGPLSPLLANIYLNPLDHLMEGKAYRIIRYADDLVLLCRSQEEAESALARLSEWVQANGLSLNKEKTRLVDMTQPSAYFDFLGYRFLRTQKSKRIRWTARPQSVKKLRNRLRSATKRKQGCSMERTIQRINPILRGWYAYFQHAIPGTFSPVDAWVRMRLRSILRKRHGRRGRGRGADHQRWPNAYFTELGLFSLSAARATVRSSA